MKEILIRKKPYIRNVMIVTAVIIGHILLFLGLMWVEPRHLTILNEPNYTFDNDPPIVYFVSGTKIQNSEISKKVLMQIKQKQKTEQFDQNRQIKSLEITAQENAQDGEHISHEGDGFVLKGRATLSQSLRFGNACFIAQKNGDPIPKNCHLTDLSQQKILAPNPNYARWKGDIAAKDAMMKYKLDAGSTDYWKRVTATPGPRYEVPEAPAEGSYSDPKAARTRGNVQPIRD